LAEGRQDFQNKNGCRFGRKSENISLAISRQQIFQKKIEIRETLPGNQFAPEDQASSASLDSPWSTI